MKISVLMSVYKNETGEHLNRALSSIWDDQTMKPDEIVLVEDGPLTADLYNCINSWKNRLSTQMVVLTNEINLGLTKSLNKGLSVAKGEYIARMDSDDISSPNRFELQSDFLDSHIDIAIVGGAIQEFSSDKGLLGIRRYPQSSDVIKKYICKASPLAHPSVMMRKEIFENLGLKYNEKYRTSQDLALWFDVLDKNLKISNLNDVVLFFRQDDDLFKRRGKEKSINEFKIYNNGINHLFGRLSWRHIFPLLRFSFRMLPTPCIKIFYNVKLRQSILS